MLHVNFPALILVLILALAVSMVVSVSIGPVMMNFFHVWKIILHKVSIVAPYIEANWKTSHEKIIWNLRLPRVILAGIVGAILAISGVGIQAVTRNSLANPYILGISSGASTGAVAAIILGGFRAFGQYSLSAGAFLGALAATLLVFLIARLTGRVTPLKMILTGIAVSAFFNAVTNYIVHSAKNEEGIRTAVYWMIGSFSGAKWEYIPLPLIGLLGAAALLLMHFRALNALLLGEETASTLGVNTGFTQTLVIVVVALITGLGVAVSGIVGFVGLVVPHIVRMLMGSDHRRVIPVSLLGGAMFLMLADALARILTSPEELPVGIITSLTGAPFFLYILGKSRYSFGGK
jgi:iron complex transport system permease protein